MTNSTRRVEHTVQWVTKGPEIPLKLVQGLQDGNVVLFCGAGVSMRAGLPSFAKLVRTVHAALGEIVPKEPRGHDERLARLELQYQNRAKVREKVRDQLMLKPGSDLRTHSALLDLAMARLGSSRPTSTARFWPAITHQSESTKRLFCRCPRPRRGTASFIFMVYYPMTNPIAKS